MKGLTDQEYEYRAKLLERIEGYYGCDDGFAELKTETLQQMAGLIAHLAAQKEAGVR